MIFKVELDLYDMMFRLSLVQSRCKLDDTDGYSILYRSQKIFNLYWP